ncbi:hypothetical protein K1719_031944 [Acacia pycnantha]|nr:hypothetical protein K1719_031944 [Acacia pycnantha]
MFEKTRDVTSPTIYYDLKEAPFERYAEDSMETDFDLPPLPSIDFLQQLYDRNSGDTGDDLIEDQTGEVLFPIDEIDSLSWTDNVYSLIDSKDLFDDPTSQPLELGAPPADMSQTSKSEVPESHASSHYLELGAPQPNQTSQSLEVQVFPNVSASPSFLNVSNQQHRLHVQQYQNVPTPQFCGYYHQFIQSPAPSNKLPGPRIICHCKKTACLKGYCSCYKAKVGCSDMCQCEGCDNPYGCESVGITSTINSRAAQRDLPNNNITSVNEKPLGGGSDTLTHNSLTRCANQNRVYEAPTLNQFAPPLAVQMAQLPANLSAPPSANQMVHVAHSQGNPLALSSNISQPQAVHNAANAETQANPFAPTYMAYPPQQQHILMNSANPFDNDATSRVFCGNADLRTQIEQVPLRLRKEATDIYQKHPPRE